MKSDKSTGEFLEMKRLKKVLMGIIIAIVALVALVYAGSALAHKVIWPEEIQTKATIKPVEGDGIELGPQFQKQAKTIAAYVQTLASQISSYQKQATKLWPDNAVSNLYAVVQDVSTKEAWRISPKGEVVKLSSDEISDYTDGSFLYVDGFDQFDTKGMKGIYLAVSKDDLLNYGIWQKYLHLGTYDPFITYAHEAFHMLEQTKWQTTDAADVENLNRDERMDDTGARASRMLLQEQLLAAIKDPSNQDKHILDALATYKQYQADYAEDFKDARFTDTAEGTAYYLELYASLYAAHPTTISTDEDVQKALSLLATRPDVYVDHGVVSEGYNIGAFAGILLDRIEGNNRDAWKKRVMSDKDISPLDILSETYAKQTLPAAQPIDDTLKAKVKSEIKAADVINEKEGKARLARFIYDILY